MLNNQRQIFFSLTSFRESAQQTADDICILRKKKNYALSGMGMGIRSSPENNHDEQRN